MTDLKLTLLRYVGGALLRLQPKATNHPLPPPPSLPPLFLGLGNHSQLGLICAHSPGMAVGGAVAQDGAKLFLFEDVGGRGAFGGRWGSLGRAGCREVCAASREAAFERSGRLH